MGKNTRQRDRELWYDVYGRSPSQVKSDNKAAAGRWERSLEGPHHGPSNPSSSDSSGDFSLSDFAGVLGVIWTLMAAAVIGEVKVLGLAIWIGGRLLSKKAFDVSIVAWLITMFVSFVLPAENVIPNFLGNLLGSGQWAISMVWFGIPLSVEWIGVAVDRISR